MPEPSSKKGRPLDVNLLAAKTVEQATGGEEAESGKNPHAVALGRLGGKKGGPARARKLTAARRQEIAQRAARVRWHGEK